MKQLTLENFKAFNGKVVIGDTTVEGKPMNILCYGENGSGKSSIYEAINTFFTKHELKMRKYQLIYKVFKERMLNVRF